MYELSETNIYPCWHYDAGLSTSAATSISREVRYELYLNHQSLGHVIASPHHLDELGLGYCLAEGYIQSPDEVAAIDVDATSHRITLRRTSIATATMQRRNSSSIVDTTAKSVSIGSTTLWSASNINGTTKSSPHWSVTSEEICSYGTLLDSITKAHHISHGVHEGAIVKAGRVLAYAEDVGRHNVLDRLLGIVSKKHIDTTDTLLIFSGRVPDSVIRKVHRIGCPILCSRAMPTELGITLADAYGITLVNKLRPTEFLVFAHPERIIADTHLINN
ncbi:formate dehydrogenase accessory sulfurtransferase FdhD [uncultured Veillonella sp.]|uniref:formate dehydrogenase accessory sulfurtransferase FdhD n=1 Tax=uncultured Veillonella sp. TaxID=159268 RepID=UPI00258FAF66|nr:formate dehydrogenase accessory sulfurtransferase FdhD [uncultured Veillonella sp.]